MTPMEFDDSVLLTIGQIARITGIKDNRTATRILEAGGVRVLRSGTWHVVERLALRQVMPAFYEALVTKLHDSQD